MVGYDEDAYWENRREQMENPGYYHRHSWDDEPEYRQGTLFLDEEIEQIEMQKGYPMEELLEGDLLDILEELKGIVAETAIWRPGWDAIDYTVRIA